MTSLAVAAPRFDHLARLTDARGLFEHARYAEPRPEHGYCLDDVARGLVVTCRQPQPDRALVKLIRQYLDFTLSALQPDGACHNRMNVAGEWTDEPALGDWWGRAVWGLGVAAVRAPTATLRASATMGFRIASQQRSPYLHAMAFAALGAGELRAARPDEESAQQVLHDARDALGPESGDVRWPWPEPRLRYANGALAEALLLCGAALPDHDALHHGLTLLRFLLSVDSSSAANDGTGGALGGAPFEGHLSVTPVGGRGPNDDIQDGAGDLINTDQQPIEVAALADACARAYQLTGDPQWRQGVRLAWAWFCGQNDNGTMMFDPDTGAGFDGLEVLGRNENQGAESTLAALSTAQHALRIGVLE